MKAEGGLEFEDQSTEEEGDRKRKNPRNLHVGPSQSPHVAQLLWGDTSQIRQRTASIRNCKLNSSKSFHKIESEDRGREREDDRERELETERQMRTKHIYPAAHWCETVMRSRKISMESKPKRETVFLI